MSVDVRMDNDVGSCCVLCGVYFFSVVGVKIIKMTMDETEKKKWKKEML